MAIATTVDDDGMLRVVILANLNEKTSRAEAPYFNLLIFLFLVRLKIQTKNYVNNESTHYYRFSQNVLPN